MESDEPKSKVSGTSVFWIIIVILIIVSSSNGSKNTMNNDSTYDYQSSGRINSEYKTIDRDEAISEHWDEIKNYLDGSETIDACSSESNNCYDLDAEISNGQVEEIYFPSGGYLYFSADIDENGEASDFDQNGDDWTFTLDMSSSIVDDAVNQWADSNDYQID